MTTPYATPYALSRIAEMQVHAYRCTRLLESLGCSVSRVVCDLANEEPVIRIAEPTDAFIDYLDVRNLRWHDGITKKVLVGECRVVWLPTTTELEPLGEAALVDMVTAP
jgi:bifunctional pyridoxal-dependent enzyme with beta-cystathionase and maltose regulon repressor activities